VTKEVFKVESEEIKRNGFIEEVTKKQLLYVRKLNSILKSSEENFKRWDKKWEDLRQGNK